MKARFVYRALKARYRDQRREIQAALSVLKAGDVAIDVGAHKGSYLFWLRKAVGSTGSVFAYEPQPALAAYLRTVSAGMGWQNVFVRDCALSDSTGVRTLSVPGSGDSPGASLERAIVESEPCRSYECIVDTVDRQFCEVERIAFLKVDVEGHELQVFRGAEATLSRCRPVILFECEARHLTSHTVQDVFRYLGQLGYAGTFFSPRGLLPLREFDPRIHQKSDTDRFWDARDYCNNFLFKPDH